jgi:hypothetical protein
MKHFLLASVFFFTGFALKAQVYYPFPDSGAVWTIIIETQSSPTNYHMGYNSYELQGDTVIGSYTYKKIINGDNSVLGGIRNDIPNHKVYFAGDFHWNNYGDTLLYNFDLNVGDTAYNDIYNSQWVTVTAIDSVIVQGQYHKRLILNDFQGEEWVEGVGSLNHPLAPLDFEFEWNNTLSCLQLANNSISYQNGNFTTSCNSWHPYPAYCGLMGETALTEENFSVKFIQNTENSLMISVQKANGPTTISVFDIAGKELFAKKETDPNCVIDLTNFASGLYILRVSDNSGNAVSEKFIR